MATKKTERGGAAAKKPAVGKTTKKAAKRPTARKAAATSRGSAGSKATGKSKVAKKAPARRSAPERVPGRKERRGVVVSDAMDKTIVVRIDAARKHKVYGKVMRRSTKLHVHDERNEAAVGDTVRLVETRPLSATKRWRLLEVLKKAR